MRVCNYCHLLCADSASSCPHDDSPTEAAQVPPVPAELSAKFKDITPFAQGKTGTCFRATQQQSGYPGLLKIIPLVAMDSAERARLKRELRKQTRLSHQGLARILDGGEAGEALWLFREFVEGEALTLRIRRDGALPVGEALTITAQVASALDELQRSGLLHRDVKPGHILLQRSPAGAATIQLIDAGIAGKLPTTAVFGLHGTPAYISPEQVLGKLISFRSDLYALGCVLFEMLKGVPPFPGDDVASVLNAHKDTPPPTVDVELPSAVQSLLRAMLAKEPRQRPFSAQQVRRTLEPLLPQGTKLPALSARIAGAMPTAPQTSSVAAAPPKARDSTPRVPGFDRDEITQEIDLNEIDAPPAVPANHATMAISEAELQELEVSDSESERPHSTMAISEAELAALQVPDEPEPVSVERAPSTVAISETELAALRVSDAAPSEAPVAAPSSANVDEVADEPIAAAPEAAVHAAPEAAAEPPAKVALPARPSVDFDVESLFGDSVAVEALPRPAAADDAPTRLHRVPTTPLPHRPIEGDPEGTVLAARPLTRRKPTPWLWYGAALLIGVVAIALWNRGDEEQAPAAVANGSSEAPAAPAPAAQQEEPEPEATKVAAAPTPAAAPSEPAPSEPAPSEPAPSAEPAPAPVEAEKAAGATEPERGGEPVPAARASRADRLAKAEEFKAQARAHYQAGRYKEAAQAYERATEQNPADAGAFAGLAASRLAAGDAKSAIDAYSRAIRLQPKSSGFHAALGRAYLQQGDRDRARAAYDRALALNPENTAAKNALAQLK